MTLVGDSMMPKGDPLVVNVLNDIANGLYNRILDQLDRFVKVLSRSKHAENCDLFPKFVLAMTDATLNCLDLQSHGIDVVKIILENQRWNEDEGLQSKLHAYNDWRSSRLAAKSKRL